MSTYFQKALARMGVPAAVAGRAEARGHYVDTTPGQQVESRGAVPRSVWLVVQGVASCQVRLDTGPVETFTLFGPGSWFNESQAVFERPSVVDIVTATPATLFELDKESFRALLSEEPDFLAAMMGLAAFRTVRLLEAMAVYKHGSPLLRLAFVLGHFAEAFDPDNGFSEGAIDVQQALELATSTHTLASLANTSRTVISELLAQVGDAGLIERRYGRVILNRYRSGWIRVRQSLLAGGALPANWGLPQLLQAMAQNGGAQPGALLAG